MIINYLKFNNLGILTDSQLSPISQGNHNVDVFYIAYDVYDYTNGYVTVSITLPNGQKLPAIDTNYKDFEFNGSKYKGFMFRMTEEMTSIAGILTMTVNLTSAYEDIKLGSSRISLTIDATDVPTDPQITNLQYNELLETIRSNYVELKSELEELKNSIK